MKIKLIATAICSVALTACVSGYGSFDLENVNIEKDVVNKNRTGTVLVDAVIKESLSTDNTEQADNSTFAGMILRLPNARVMRRSGNIYENIPIDLPNNSRPAAGSVINIQNTEIQNLSIQSNVPANKRLASLEYNFIHYVGENIAGLTVKKSKIILNNLTVRRAEPVSKYDFKDNAASGQTRDLVNGFSQNFNGYVCCSTKYKYSQFGIIGGGLFMFNQAPRMLLQLKPEDTYHLFYRGIQEVELYPVALSSLTYEGDWNYVKSYQHSGGIEYDAGEFLNNSYLPSSFIEAFQGIAKPAKFLVNFNEKTLTGKLKYGTHEDTEEAENAATVYTLDATITGNNYAGTVTATNPDHATFNTNSDTLKGAFYGPRANELGGYFTTPKKNADEIGDHSLAVVFIAKRDVPADEALDIKKDTVTLTTPVFRANGDTSLPLNSFFTTNEAYNFANVNTITLANGVTVDLTDVVNSNPSTGKPIKNTVDGHDNAYYYKCCGNLQYIKQIAFYDTVYNQTSLTLVSQGVRTEVSDLPTVNQNILYEGNWLSYASKEVNSQRVQHDYTGALNADQFAGDSRFLINFHSKEFIGQLVAPGGLDANMPINSTQNIFSLTGNIVGNSFSGSVTMLKGLVNYDINNQEGVKRIPATAMNPFKGAFYGPQANELGGYFTSTDKSIGVIFNGKKRVEKK